MECKEADFTPITHISSLVGHAVGVIVKSRFMAILPRSEKVSFIAITFPRLL
jgi:hypothetical protein